jgi:ankyrin repeat protein
MPADTHPPALWEAVLHGATEQARQLLLGGADIEEKGPVGSFFYTPLQLAVSRVRLIVRGHDNHMGMVQLLLEHGAEVTVRNHRGETPLHDAARRGYAEAALQLIQHGADVTTRADNGETPLASAARGGAGTVAVVLVLLQYRSDEKTVDALSMTPLHWAAFRGHAGMVRLLLEHGANVLTTDATGTTAEQWADYESHPEVVAILKAEAVIRANCVAFAMGNQERLGVRSRVLWFDPELVRMVIVLV